MFESLDVHLYDGRISVWSAKDTINCDRLDSIGYSVCVVVGGFVRSMIAFILRRQIQIQKPVPIGNSALQQSNIRMTVCGNAPFQESEVIAIWLEGIDAPLWSNFFCS